MQAAPLGVVTAAPRENADGPRRPFAEPVVWTAAMAAVIATTLVGQDHSFLALDVAVGVASVGLVPLLGRWPVPAALALSVLAALSPAATPPATLAVLLVARWRRLSVAVLVAGIGIGAHLIREGWRPLAGLPYGWWVVLVVVAYAALVGWGTLLRANRALISSLRERAELAEAEQGRRVSEARAAERARIAREMHDVLAHRLSLLATYAGALSYRPDAPPEQLSRAAEVIRSGVHQALDELREVIGVLRDDSSGDASSDGAAAGLSGSLSAAGLSVAGLSAAGLSAAGLAAAGRRPLPGIADLPGLLSECRDAGMRVEFDGGGWDPGEVPDTIGRTVYRVVQEGLTNARKHAPGEAVRLTLGGGPGTGLDISIANRLRDAGLSAAGLSAAGLSAAGLSAAGRAAVPGTGTGLIGVAERVEIAGGRLERRDADGEFRLHAWLPWPDDRGAA